MGTPGCGRQFERTLRPNPRSAVGAAFESPCVPAPPRRAAMVFIAALLPFGPFVVDRRMRQYEAELG